MNIVRVLCSLNGVFVFETELRGFDGQSWSLGDDQAGLGGIPCRLSSVGIVVIRLFIWDVVLNAPRWKNHVCSKFRSFVNFPGEGSWNAGAVSVACCYGQRVRVFSFGTIDTCFRYKGIMAKLASAAWLMPAPVYMCCRTQTKRTRETMFV